MRPEILEKIGNCNNKTKIDLANMGINDDEIEEIMQKINPFQLNISLINLDGNNLCDNGAIILSQCLHEFHQLSELSLQFNAIGREGAISVFGLKRSVPLLDILFHGNKISDVGEMAEIEEIAQQQNVLFPI